MLPGLAGGQPSTAGAASSTLTFMTNCTLAWARLQGEQASLVPALSGGGAPEAAIGA